MAIKQYKPVSPGRRDMSTSDRSVVTRNQPERSLSSGLRSSGGRNNNGRITTRFRGGGAKRRYRQIDFRRDKDGIPAKVASIEYDPNRSCYIALVNYADGEKRYILAPAGLNVGDTVESGSVSAMPCRSGAFPSDWISTILSWRRAAAASLYAVPGNPHRSGPEKVNMRRFDSRAVKFA